jgi:hypothetical protein
MSYRRSYRPRTRRSSSGRALPPDVQLRMAEMERDETLRRIREREAEKESKQ